MANAPEHVRRLAVSRVKEGYKQLQVARFLGVSERSVRRWVLSERKGGDGALTTRPRPGRPPKLDAPQASMVLGWLAKSPWEFGFPTERWTGPRVAELIDRELGVEMNHRYVNDWLAQRGITPQIPTRVATERNDDEVEWWVRNRWPRIKKKRVTPAPTWFLPTKLGF